MEPIVWAVLLLLLGVALIVLEMFIPSHGLLGVLAAAAIIAGIVMAFRQGLIPGVITLSTAAVVVPVVIGVGLHYWPKTPFGRRMLIQPQDMAGGPEESPELLEMAALVGQRGKAKSKMLPSGAVLIAGHTYDAYSQGGAIDPGQPIVVVAIRANRIVVRPLEEHELAAPCPPPPAVAAASGHDPILSQPVEALGIEPLDDPLA